MNNWFAYAVFAFANHRLERDGLRCIFEVQYTATRSKNAGGDNG